MSQYVKLKLNGFREIIKKGEVAEKIDRIDGGVYKIQIGDRVDHIYELDCEKVEKKQD